MQAAVLFFGVDVSKADLAVAEHGRGGVRSVLNDAQAINAWLDQLPPAAVLAMESTGVYHRLLAKLAYARGLRVYVLNARDVYFYAKALGARGKTDRVDAGVIARYVAEHHAQLHPWRMALQAHTHIQELTQRRAVLAAKRSSVRQTLRGCDSLVDPLQRLQQAFDDLLAAIDAQVHQLIEADASMAAARGACPSAAPRRFAGRSRVSAPPRPSSFSRASCCVPPLPFGRQVRALTRAN